MTDTETPSVMPSGALPEGLVVRGPVAGRAAEILTPEALAFVARLQQTFGRRRDALLARRDAVHQQLAAGLRPDFLPETESRRRRHWTVAELPADLLDRRVEITGPVDRKMIINALNSGASVFMADFEDSSAPTWSVMLDGQINLHDAVRRTINYTAPQTGKRYELDAQTATLFVRPRGWHLPEAHLLVDDRPASASLFDFGLYLFHNAAELVERGTGPYFYLPKLESHLEARLWNDVFLFAQDELGLPRGTIKATVLIETILAAFEMDEILYELREHSAGLNCGRWDYIFSFIKRFGGDPAAVFPDRGLVGMTQQFLHSYSQLLIKTCHRRGVHAMGGMAAQIPIKDDAAANAEALDRVRADKLREVNDGHDGTWVAHPALVPLAREIFDQHMPGPNQIDNLRLDVAVDADDLLTVPSGPRTEAGLRQNVNVGILYLQAWLCGNGCVPLYHLMEDAATAEISRTQVWQWVHHGSHLQDGRRVDVDLVRQIIVEELASIRRAHGNDLPRLAEAAGLFEQLATAQQCVEFLTSAAYPRITTFTD